MTQKLFLTGATGSIGHYILDQALAMANMEVHILVREPKNLLRNPGDYPNLVIHQGSLENIEALADIIKEMTHVIHIATAWNNDQHAIYINKEKTHVLFDLLDSNICQKIVYFSTASIMGPGNKITDAAYKHGTGYIKSKYVAYKSLPESKLYDKTVTVFPTMVFGGSEKHPASHITEGLKPNLGYAKYIRFFDVDASFHFLHGYDIAQVALYALFNDTDKDLVLGQPLIQGNDVLNAIYKRAGIKKWFTIPIRPWFVLILCKLFRIELAPWDHHCITHAHMAYKTVNPETYGLTSKFKTISDILDDIFAMNYLRPN